MLFEELNTGSGRINDPEERESGSVVKSKKTKAKKLRSTSVSFTSYKTLKNILTFVLGGAIVVGVAYIFYISVMLFIGG